MAIVLDIETAPIDDAEQYLTDREPIEAPSNYKDPQKIADYIARAEREQAEKLAKSCSLDPDLGKLVALGWVDAHTKSEPTVWYAKDERGEREMIEAFVRDAVTPHAVQTLITFNGLRFDLPFLMRRALYLGVKFPALNIDKYRSPHIDLMDALSFKGVLKPHSLKFYAARFGIQVDDVLTGKDIGQLVKDGEWDQVAAHCTADVMATKALAARLGYLTQAA